MGNYVEMHADKRRGRMDISDIGKEALIHWNGPPIAKAGKLGEAALDRVFGGRNRFPSKISIFCVDFMPHRWNFVTRSNKSDSLVTARLRKEEPDFPFFC